MAIRYCVICGAELNEETSFCAECGEEVPNEVESQKENAYKVEQQYETQMEMSLLFFFYSKSFRSDYGCFRYGSVYSSGAYDCLVQQQILVSNRQGICGQQK